MVAPPTPRDPMVLVLEENWARPVTSSLPFKYELQPTARFDKVLTVPPKKAGPVVDRVDVRFRLEICANGVKRDDVAVMLVAVILLAAVMLVVVEMGPSTVRLLLRYALAPKDEPYTVKSLMICAEAAESVETTTDDILPKPNCAVLTNRNLAFAVFILMAVASVGKAKVLTRPQTLEVLGVKEAYENGCVI
jgi:hypothetical protein